MAEDTPLPDDVERLKALLLERDADLAHHRAALEERDLEISQLREYVRLLKSQRFGAASERVHRDQLGLFNEAEQLAEGEATEPAPAVEVDAHTRSPRGRRKLPSWMPREEIVHDLAADEKVCPHDGTALVEIGRETSEQVEFIPATARVLVHVRPKYASPGCKQGVKIAPLPPQPVPKSVASPSLLAYVAVSKYADALPLYRQEGMLERIGIDVSRATLASWMVKVGELVQPLVDRMREELLASGFVQCDESRYQVLKEPGKAAASLSYIWVQRAEAQGHPLILYEYDRSRSAEVPKRLFEGYAGVLQTDGYEGYGAIGRERGIVHVGCRVGGDVAAPAPHRSGRAGFPHPVLHGIDSLATVY